MEKTEIKKVTGISESEFMRLTQNSKPKIEIVNPLFAKIQKVLDYKKQVILYGPPGTGKTWVASNFTKSKSNPDPIARKLSRNKKFFWYTEMNAEGRSFFEKQQISEENGVDDQAHAYEEIEKGDFVIIYDARGSRLIGIASCEGKYPPTEHGIWDMTLKGIKPFQGPLWKTIEEDPILRNSEPVKYNELRKLVPRSDEPAFEPQLKLYPQQLLWNILFPLTKEEGVRLLELAQVSLKDLDIPDIEDTEKVEIPGKKCLSNFITFHPSYAYEEFIEGLRPIADDVGNIHYEIQEGIFKRASREALTALLEVAEIDQEWQDQAPVPTFSQEKIEKIQEVVDRVPCYLVIDEINRGDISRIFGELITLVESDKRLFCENEIRCKLPYSKMEFGIPPNLFIIGTMNTADRSISLMDIALRRRFGFIELLPDYDALKAILMNDTTVSKEVREYRSLAIQSLKTVNEKLTEKYDRDHQIGHSYPMKLSQVTSIEETIETLTNIWRYEIIPLLQEYFYDSPEKLLYITNNRFFEKSGSSFVLKSENDIIEALKAVAGQK